jgi:hypothetical protein
MICRGRPSFILPFIELRYTRKRDSRVQRANQEKRPQVKSHFQHNRE